MSRLPGHPRPALPPVDLPAAGGLRLVQPKGAQAKGAQPAVPPLAQVLLDADLVAPGDLVKALALQARQQVALGDILMAHGMLDEAALMQGLALQWRAEPIDPLALPPDPRLIDVLGAQDCLGLGLLPWRRVGGATVVATCRPDGFGQHLPALQAAFGPVVMALVAETVLHRAVLNSRCDSLRQLAETRVSAAESCRSTDLARLRIWAGGLALGSGAALVLAPVPTLGVLTLWAVAMLLLTMGLKTAAAVAGLRARAEAGRAAWDRPRPAIARLPVVSILVPLYGEDDIAPRLVARLGRIVYPRELFDVLLVVEEGDRSTRAALAQARLPHWMRVVTVPDGPLKTKPRALNFALDFCRGSIIGVYDAEDAPDSDQIHRVVRRFHERGSELACVQGMLDYYNPRINWLSRCFTIEYAAWFRILLPGMERLGLAVPLGGTTLFFRRGALVALGGWDAHNVTEDADLGIRLARHGYRTEVLDTVTQEEANCRLLPWIRQRSRWLKGYAITYAVHMRAPRRLWRDLGAWRFFGFQVLFLGTLSNFVLLPLLWSFWLLFLGLGHPLQPALGLGGSLLLGAAFVLSELVNSAVALLAVWRGRHAGLRVWVPTLHLYFPLAALAIYKALWEVATRPFYWDKTAHGLHDGAPEAGQLPLAGARLSRTA